MSPVLRDAIIHIVRKGSLTWGDYAGQQPMFAGQFDLPKSGAAFELAKWIDAQTQKKIREGFSAMARKMPSGGKDQGALFADANYTAAEAFADMLGMDGSTFLQSSMIPKIVKRLFSSSSVKEMRQKVKEWAKRNIRGTYTNIDTGWDIDISMEGIKHSISGAKPNLDVICESLQALPDIIKTAKFEKSEIERGKDTNVKAWHYFSGKAIVDNATYDVRVSVKEIAEGRKYYDHVMIEYKRPSSHPRSTINGIVNTGREKPSKNNLPDGSDDSKEFFQASARHGSPHKSITLIKKARKGFNPNRAYASDDPGMSRQKKASDRIVQLNSRIVKLVREERPPPNYH